MLRDLVNRVKTEIDSEKKIREQSEEQILNLIEEALAKLESWNHSLKLYTLNFSFFIYLFLIFTNYYKILQNHKSSLIYSKII